MIKVSKILKAYTLEEVEVPITYGGGSAYSPWNQHDVEATVQVMVDHDSRTYDIQNGPSEIDASDYRGDVIEWMAEHFPGYEVI